MKSKEFVFPLYATHLQAGFPAPAEDVSAEKFDLAAYLIPHPPATFFVRVSGDSMIGTGIFSNDILIVDKSLEPRNGDIVVAVVDGEFTVKRLVIRNKKIELRSENPKFPSIKIADETELNVWGVVKNVIHPV